MKHIVAASILLSSLALPAAAVASQPVNDDSSAPTPARPVSSGFTAPHIIRSADIMVSPEFAATLHGDSTVVLQLNLDEQGKPADIQVIKSLNPSLDATVVDAVRKFRWSPAVLNKQAVATDLTLSVVVQR